MGILKDYADTADMTHTKVVHAAIELLGVALDATLDDMTVGAWGKNGDARIERNFNMPGLRKRRLTLSQS